MSVICCSLSGFSQHTWAFCNWQRCYLKRADCTIYTALFSWSVCFCCCFQAYEDYPNPSEAWKVTENIVVSWHFFSLLYIPDSMLLLMIILQYSERQPSSDCVSLKTIHVFVLLCEWTFHNRTSACKTAPDLRPFLLCELIMSPRCR